MARASAIKFTVTEVPLESFQQKRLCGVRESIFNGIFKELSTMKVGSVKRFDFPFDKKPLTSSFRTAVYDYAGKVNMKFATTKEDTHGTCFLVKRIA